MPRNLDNRVEVLVPVYDPEIRKELWDILQIQLSDNCKARISGTNFINEYRKTDSKKIIRAQFEIYNYFKSILNA
jgi:polyphosphate kinase